ncbi:hypothetical protein FO519_009143, partial [Halicephalobus sp. NKZ332]
MSIDGDFLRSVEVRSDDEDGSLAALFCKTALAPGHIVGVIDKIYVQTARAVEPEERLVSNKWIIGPESEMTSEAERERQDQEERERILRQFRKRRSLKVSKPEVPVSKENKDDDEISDNK